MPHQIVLFHSALGLRPAVLDFADRLRSAGHVVHTPDLFDGEVFDTLADGVAKRDSLGIEELMRRAWAAVEPLPASVVYAGFSMGTGAATFLAASRPGARGAILMHGALAPAALGMEAWPPVPVQLHFAARDPEVDQEQVEGLVAAATAAGVEVDVQRYDGEAHLFGDAGTPEYDAGAAARMERQALDFLDRIAR